MRCRPSMIAVLVLAVASASAAGQDTGEPITFTSGGSRIAGRLFAGASRPAPTVILLHGFPGGRGDVLGFGEALSASGWNAISFTFRGVYESEGAYTLANTVDDVIAAEKFLRSRPDILAPDAPLAVLGWSGGGWSALMAAARDENLDCAVSVAGANMAVWARQIVGSADARRFWEDMLERFTTGSPARGKGGKASVMELLENSIEYDLLTHADALARKRLLIVGGWKDQQVTLEETVLPLVRGLRSAGAAHVAAATLDDDHSFEATRSSLHGLVLDWLNSACVDGP